MTTWTLHYTPYADLLEAVSSEKWKPSALVPIGPDLAVYLSEDNPSELVAFYIESFATRFAESNGSTMRLVLGEETFNEIHTYLTERVRPFVSELPHARDLTASNAFEHLTSEPEPWVFEVPAATNPEVEAARLVAFDILEKELGELQARRQRAATSVLEVMTEGLRLMVDAVIEEGRAVVELARIPPARPLPLAAAEGEPEEGIVFESQLGWFRVWRQSGELWLEGTVYLDPEVGGAERPVSVVLELAAGVEVGRQSGEVTVSFSANSEWSFHIPVGRLTSAPPVNDLVRRIHVVVGEPEAPRRNRPCDELPVVFPEGVVDIYRKAWKLAYDVALAKTGHPTDSYLIATESVCKLINNWDSIDPQRWQGWLRRTVRNAVIDLHRRRKGRRAVELEPGPFDDEASPGPIPDALKTPAADADIYATLETEDLLSCLPPKCREIFALQAEGLNLVDIAERLGLAHGTVRNEASRCRRLGEEWLKRLGYE